MDNLASVLIAAISGRALAASARRGGYVPLVADFFGDQDTLALADAHVRLDAELAHGIDGHELLQALVELAVSRRHLAGVVCGTGFEDRPNVLARIASRWPLLGNKPETVGQIKDPLSLAALCRDCNVSHPEVSTTRPCDPAGWLAKRRGGAGGIHVTPAIGRDPADRSIYFQRRVSGIPVSVMLIADGRRAMILGFSTQWSSPAARHRFRYGGAVRPATVSAETTAALAAAVQRLISAVPLVGLNSADFLVDGEDFWLLEINPRPGATLDIFEPTDGSLFALHVAACRGELADEPPTFDGAMAAGIAYAEHDIPSVPVLDWPDWTADRQNAGTSVNAGRPLCTVIASASTAVEAKALVNQRIATIHSCVDAWVS